MISPFSPRTCDEFRHLRCFSFLLFFFRWVRERKQRLVNLCIHLALGDDFYDGILLHRASTEGKQARYRVATAFVNGRMNDEESTFFLSSTIDRC